MTKTAANHFEAHGELLSGLTRGKVGDIMWTPKGPRTLRIGLEGPYHEYYSIWAPKPYCLGPWTLRGLYGFLTYLLQLLLEFRPQNLGFFFSLF